MCLIWVSTYQMKLAYNAWHSAYQTTTSIDFLYWRLSNLYTKWQEIIAQWNGWEKSAGFYRQTSLKSLESRIENDCRSIRDNRRLDYEIMFENQTYSMLSLEDYKPCAVCYQFINLCLLCSNMFLFCYFWSVWKWSNIFSYVLLI